MGVAVTLEQVAVDRLWVLAEPSSLGADLQEEVVQELIESMLRRVQLALEHSLSSKPFDLARVSRRMILCREVHGHELGK